MKTIDLQNLASVIGGANTLSRGEMYAWRSGMAQRTPHIGSPGGSLPTRVPSNLSIGEMSAWRSGMDRGGPGKK